MKISVLISTRNRACIQDCLVSLLQSTFTSFEILLVDQSTNLETEKIVNRLKSQKITYLKMRQKGKSKALNLLLQNAKSEILAFTDDDCVVDKFWLEEIYKFFTSHPKTAGVFGNTFPYETEKHLQEICPATFTSKKESNFSDPSTIHFKSLGQGNNMSLRKSVIAKVGPFKDWLGVGSFAQAGEESELIFRLLLDNHILTTNPKMIVYHNRWLTRLQANIQNSNYTCGLMAFYTFYLFGKHRTYAYKFIRLKLSERLLAILKQVKYLGLELIKEMIFLIIEIFSVLKGFCFGILFAVIKKIWSR